MVTSSIGEYPQEVKLLNHKSHQNVVALLPEQELREIMLSHDHFNDIIQHLIRRDTKAASASDMLLFFKEYIRLTLTGMTDSKEIKKKCDEVVEQDQFDLQEPLTEDEKNRWKRLQQQICKKIKM